MHNVLYWYKELSPERRSALNYFLFPFSPFLFISFFNLGRQGKTRDTKMEIYSFKVPEEVNGSMSCKALMQILVDIYHDSLECTLLFLSCYRYVENKFTIISFNIMGSK